jgi:hypothetical protein
MRPDATPVIFRGGKTTTAACEPEHSRSLTGRPEGRDMDALTPTAVVHFYDTHRHAILCGVRGFEHRSSKHARSVTCEACVGLLGKHPAMTPAASSAAP